MKKKNSPPFTAKKRAGIYNIHPYSTVKCPLRENYIDDQAQIDQSLTNWLSELQTQVNYHSGLGVEYDISTMSLNDLVAVTKYLKGLEVEHDNE